MDSNHVKNDPKKEPERGQWDRPIEFFLACVGYAVGVGNVWRFPYLCFKNGGGAFLIPYCICLIVAGIPIFYLELSLGQFSSLGPIGLFERLAPIFEGIGWGMVVVTFITAVFYNMLLAWILYYLAISFRSTLLWSTCRNEWNTALCHSNLETATCVEKYGEGWGFYNKTCLNATELLAINDTYQELLAGKRRSPAEEFFEDEVLNISKGFEEIGGLQWKLVLCLLIAWVLILFCLIKGVKSTGKVVYFTATFPYVVLMILLIRGLTLDGAGDGIKYYLTPNVTKLQEITVWKDAATQIFFSLSTAFGGLLTMASYNTFHNNCYKDAILVSLINCGTSFFAGFAVFSIAGFMAKDLKLPVQKVVRDGIGLAFIAYPEAIVRMPISPLWSVLFFFMLLTLGIDSMMVFVETVTTGLQDQFAVLHRHKVTLLFGTCVVGFLCGLPFCTRAGIFIFTLLNDMAAGYSVLLLAICEVMALAWFYGARRFFRDIEMMLGVNRSHLAEIIGPTGFYWWIDWVFVCPVFLSCIVVLIFIFYSKSRYGEYEFPPGAEAVGWIASALSIGCVPLFALYRLLQYFCTGKPVMSLFCPTVEWCPASMREERAAQGRANQQESNDFRANRTRTVEYPGSLENRSYRPQSVLNSNVPPSHFREDSNRVRRRSYCQVVPYNTEPSCLAFKTYKQPYPYPMSYGPSSFYGESPNSQQEPSLNYGTQFGKCKDSRPSDSHTSTNLTTGVT